MNYKQTNSFLTLGKLAKQELNICCPLNKDWLETVSTNTFLASTHD